MGYPTNYTRFVEKQIQQDNITSCIFREMTSDMAEMLNTSLELRLKGDQLFIPFYGRQTSIYSYYVGCGALSFLGIVGNILVITHFIKQYYKNMRKMPAYYFLLMVLAFIDEITCSVHLLLLTDIVKITDWRYSLGSTAFLNGLSIYILLPVAYMRYLSIVYPFREKWSKKKCMLILVFLSNAVFCYTALYIYVASSLGEQYAVIGDILLRCIVPVGTLFYILKLLSDNLRRVRKSNYKIRDTVQVRNNKTFGILRFLTIAATLSILPGKCAAMLAVLLHNYGCFSMRIYSITASLTGVASMLYMSNSVINFFVYAKFIREFRQFLCEIFTCGLFTKKKRTVEIRNVHHNKVAYQ